MVPGYIGKVLWVDLTNHTLKEEVLDKTFCRRVIGGYGLGAGILLSRQRAGVEVQPTKRKLRH